MKNVFRHLISFAAPLMMGFVLPYLIIRVEQKSLIPSVTASNGLLIIGITITTIGLICLIAIIRMFIAKGNGTIMPWDPTRKLIVRGWYRYVRNPMILSLIILQAGEAVLFASFWIAVLAIINFIANTFYFILSEEPMLEKRFGAEYIKYKENVRRWIPRLKPWQPA